MRTEEYQKISFAKFNGWYARGDKDTVPMDHAVDCKNMFVHDPGNMETRYGSKMSFIMSHKAVNMFMATPNAGPSLLTLDDVGNLYKESGTSSTLLVSVPGAIDFVGLNMFGRVYLNFIKTTFPAEPIKVWDGINPVRDAAGLAPTYPLGGGSLTVAVNPGGVVSLGQHRIAVCYVTNTGYITPPGPIISGLFLPALPTSDGTKQFAVTNIPIGPPGTVRRILLMTKGDELQYFQVPDPLDSLNNNTVTGFNINVSDEELIVDGSYLFDILDKIPGAIGDGGLNKYKGRLLVWGGEFDLIRASYAGEPETFSDVTGYVQLPSEADGNYVKGCFLLRDTLYFTKAVGIFSTQDLNGEEPSNWPVTIIDGSVGSWNSGISTITSSQSGLPMNDVLLLVDLEGVHVFTGTVQQPPLTWKIQDIWRAIPKTSYQKITITVDPYNRLIYIVSPEGPYGLLVGDYTEGLDAQNIKWSHWDLPFVPRAIALCNIQDMDSWDYYLRVASSSSGQIIKMVPGTADDFGTPIQSIYQFAYTPIDVGAVNLFRAVRLRAKGSGNLNVGWYHEDGLLVGVSQVALDSLPVKDYLREFNTMNEKISIQLMSFNNYFHLTRLDLFGKSKFRSRPA